MIGAHEGCNPRLLNTRLHLARLKLAKIRPVRRYAWRSGFLLGDSRRPQLWMGTHPSGPSKLLLSGQDLKQYLAERPERLGEAVRRHFGSDLPFLFKVLAISKALSIQAHPDKQLAAQLHKDHPEIYKGVIRFLPRRA
jgi:mannose-6-phosphate isomerase class I